MGGGGGSKGEGALGDSEAREGHPFSPPSLECPEGLPNFSPQGDSRGRGGAWRDGHVSPLGAHAFPHWTREGGRPRGLCCDLAAVPTLPPAARNECGLWPRQECRGPSPGRSPELGDKHPHFPHPEAGHPREHSTPSLSGPSRIKTLCARRGRHAHQPTLHDFLPSSVSWNHLPDKPLASPP